MQNPGPRPNRNVKLPASFVILMLFCFCGLMSGCVFHQVTPTTYESNAAFRVRATGIKLPVGNFDFEEVTNHRRHDKSLVRPGFIALALKEARLDGLDSFKQLSDDELAAELADEDPLVTHVINNLVVKQREEDPPEAEPVSNSDPPIYEVTYSESNADDAQTVLNEILDAYETWLEKQLLWDVQESTRSLKELYAIAGASLVQEKAKNASEGVVARLEERLVEILTQIQNLEYYSDGLEKPKFLSFVVLEKATYGVPVYPILYKCLLAGLLVGLLLGLAFITPLELIKASNSKKINQRYSEYAAQGRQSPPDQVE